MATTFQPMEEEQVIDQLPPFEHCVLTVPISYRFHCASVILSTRADPDQVGRVCEAQRQKSATEQLLRNNHLESQPGP
jgi:hypothetical protein